ncbi:MAG: hypothetical protein HYU77_11945 [Betaproteobacteria bacterium]|nr:hypothetical protein [Betaproteobacteria bacterium]
MSAFWIVGIAVNVGLTGLALWWVFRQMKPRETRKETTAAQSDLASTESGKGAER